MRVEPNSFFFRCCCHYMYVILAHFTFDRTRTADTCIRDSSIGVSKFLWCVHIYKTPPKCVHWWFFIFPPRIQTTHTHTRKDEGAALSRATLRMPAEVISRHGIHLRRLCDIFITMITSNRIPCTYTERNYFPTYTNIVYHFSTFINWCQQLYA